jgi:hypothetical protein
MAALGRRVGDRRELRRRASEEPTNGFVRHPSDLEIAGDEGCPQVFREVDQERPTGVAGGR